jgi:hypothetical protein
LAVALALANNVKVQYGSTTAVAVFALTVYKVIRAIYAGTIRNQPKVVAVVKVCIVINVVAIKDVVYQEFSKAETAVQAVQIHKKVVRGFMSGDLWLSAYFLTAHDVLQTTALDQH